MKSYRILLIAGAMSLAPSAAVGQEGPVVSNLKRALVYIYGYSAVDHQNTTAYAGHLMALGRAHGFNVDTTRSHAAFTPANLANYQAVVLFSAYAFGAALSAAQKDALKAWYSGNRGLACFHQCAKNDWGGAPNWFDNLMGVRYQTYAGFKTGPIFVHADAVGTDLAMSSAGTPYAADYTLSWDDEWYTYQANPEPLPGTRMIWTTRRSALDFGSGSSGFYLPGEIQPMAWARDAEGGRFVMNSMFHRDVPRTSTNPQLRQFIDGAFLGTLRHIAGYTGCTQPGYREYNPKATHLDAGACLTPAATGIRAEAARSASGDPGGIDIDFALPGPHEIDIFDASGRLAYSRRGREPARYRFARGSAGLHYARIRQGSTAFSKRFLLL